MRKAGEQQRHACDVAIVFTGLIRASQNHIVNRAPIHGGVALNQGPNRNRRQIVGTDRGEHSAVAAEGGPDCVTDEGVRHAVKPARSTIIIETEIAEAG